MAELDRLSAPRHWVATRAFFGFVAAVPVFLATASLGFGALGAALATAALGFAVAPLFLASLRRRAEQALLDELAVHLDLIALAVEAGSSLTSAINACAERAPDGPLRRAWARAVLDIHAGAEVQEVLRELEQRVALRPLSAGGIGPAQRGARGRGRRGGAARASASGGGLAIRARGTPGARRAAQALGHADVVHRAVHAAGARVSGGAACWRWCSTSCRRAAGA